MDKLKNKIKLKQLIKKVNNRLKKLDENEIKPFIKMFGPDELLFFNSLYSDGPTLYLKWLYCLTRELKPKKIVELGAFAGASTAMFLAGMEPESVLFSVDVDPKSWGVVSEDKRLIKVIGNDVSKKAIFPEGTELGDTSLWFIDSEHTGRHLKKEIKKYGPLWKKGTIVVVDDVQSIEFPDYTEAWRELPYEKVNLKDLHYTGFGIFIV